MKKLLLLKADSKYGILDLLNQSTYPTDKISTLGSGPVRLCLLLQHQDQFQKLKKQIVTDLEASTSTFYRSDFFTYSERSIPVEQRAFLFPGQGSQYVQMLQHLQTYTAFSETFEQLLRKFSDKKLALASLYNGMEAGIDQTQFTQPLLTCANMASLRLLESHNILAAFSAGHSFGELCALKHSELISLDELVDMSLERGRVMAEANILASGKMLAIFERDNHNWKNLHQKIVDLIPQAENWLANINSPSQIVYSAGVDDIEELAQICFKHQIRSTMLTASAAFHSPLMKPAEVKFHQFLQKLLTTKRTRVNTVIACNPVSSYQNTSDVVTHLSQQLTHQVDWIHAVNTLATKGVKLFIEVGPKNILTKLTQEILGEDYICLNLDGTKELENFLMPLLALGIEVKESQKKLDAVVSNVTIATSKGDKENKIIKGFLEKQQLLMAQVSQLSAGEQSAVKRIIAADTEEVLANFFKIEGLTPQTNEHSTLDPSTELILNEISLLTGFKVSEISLDARFDSDLYLDSMTKLELLSNLSEKFKADVSDMTALLNANSVRELNAIISKYKVQNSQEELRDEVAWLRNEIINYTGISTDKISPSSSFNEDLMLDSLIKLELIANLKTRFPQLDLKIEELTRVNSLLEIQTLLIKHQGRLTGEGHEKKSSLSIKENLAHFLNLKLEKIQSTSDFEHDLRLNIFEKEDFINSLIVKHPYLQLAVREMLHAKTLGDLLEIEEIFDRRSKTRGSDEEVSRFEFELEEIKFKQESRKDHPDHAYLLVGPWEKNIGFKDFFADQKYFTLPTMSTLRNQITNLGSFSCYFIFLQFSHLSWERANIEKQIEEIYELCQSLNQLSPTKLCLIYDSHHNPLIASLPAALKSLSKEVTHSFRLLDMTINKTTTKSIPWQFFYQNTNERFISLTQQGNNFFREAIKIIEPPKVNAHITLPASPHILLVGGARGITSEIAKFLADYRQATVSAIGRTPLSATRPFDECQSDAELRDELKKEILKTHAHADASEQNFLFNLRYTEVNNQREIWNTKDSIERRGGVFHYISADATKSIDLKKAVSKIQKDFGKIDGIIHAVGLTRDNLLKNKSYEDFRQVVQSKIASAYNVYETFSDEKKLSFVCFFSSLSSWSGAPGQTDYSYANEVLNQLAIKWNAQSPYPVAALLWSVWSETGLAQDNLLLRMQELKLSGISNRAGIRLFKEEVLHHGLNHSKVLFTPKSTLNYSIGKNV